MARLINYEEWTTGSARAAQEVVESTHAYYARQEKRAFGETRGGRRKKLSMMGKVRMYRKRKIEGKGNASERSGWAH